MNKKSDAGNIKDTVKKSNTGKKRIQRIKEIPKRMVQKIIGSGCITGYSLFCLL